MRQDMVNSIIQHVVKKLDILYVDTMDAYDFDRIGERRYYAFYINPDVQNCNCQEAIYINPLKGPYTNERKISLFFHELGHATGRASRLNRIGITTKPSKLSHLQDTIEEIIAEKSAKILMRSLELYTPETLAVSDEYIDGRIKTLLDVEREFIHMTTSLEAKKVATYILDNWLNDFKVEFEVA